MPYGQFMRPISDGLVSPVPQSFFVLQRALDMDVHMAAKTCHYLLKRGRSLVVRSKAVGKAFLDPNGDWSIIRDKEETCPDGWIMIPVAARERQREEPSSADVAFNSSLTTHQISIMILDDAIALANHTNTTDRQSKLVQALKDRMFWTLGTELRGRTAADTALTLALAGIVDHDLYAMLYKIVFLELNRRKQRKVKDVLHTIEKAAASGAPANHAMFQIARECLEGQNVQPDILDRVKGEMTLLTDDRPPLWLWRFASRFPRPSLTQRSGQEFMSLFARPDQPLVVDLGCGFGLTLLGLACQNHTAYASGEIVGADIVSGDYNLLGCDANPLNVNYGRGIASRWNVNDHLQYVCCSASDLLTELIGASVPLHSVLLQFPTPYRLNDEGNQQLPPSSDTSFMASRGAIRQIAQLNAGVLLLIQSNCEDVAMQMFRWATDEGLKPVQVPQPVIEPSPLCTERTQRWLKLHGEQPVRAVGPYWSSVPLLQNARSETEVACVIQNIPIHRCLLRVSKR